MKTHEYRGSRRICSRLSLSLLEGLNLSKISGMCKADQTAILDILMDGCTLIGRGSVDVIAFFVLALRDLRDLSNFSSGQRTR